MSSVFASTMIPPIWPSIPTDPHKDLSAQSMDIGLVLLDQDGRMHAKELIKNKRIVTQVLATGEFCCYILTTLDRTRTYVCHSKNLRRRLEQHLGNLPGGAEATKGRSWEVLAYGTAPTKIIAKELERKVKAVGECTQVRLDCLKNLGREFFQLLKF